MAQTSLIIGNKNWAVKEDSLLGYNVIQNKYLPIPIDTVRATTATRVNEQGLIEIVPRNLLQYSQEFENAYWLKDSGVTVNSNVSNAPNGTLTADRINFSTSGIALYSVVDFTTTAKLSVYLKGEGTNIGKQIYLEIAGTGSLSVTLTAEWNRFIIDANTANAVAIKRLSSGQADSVLAWGIQLENGSVATEYFPTTNRLDIPRIDYSTGSAALLVEPQRTNLYFPSIPSSSGSGTYTLNDAISPDGTQNASSFLPSGFGVVYSNSISTTVQTYTFSVYLKGTVNGQKVGLGDNGNILNNFTITTSWQRYTFTFTGSVQNTPFYLLSGNYFSPAENNKFYIYGAQLEVGSYATSLIPTQASSVTRNADVISKTGISSLIGQTEGTIFWDATNLFTSGSRSLALIYTSLSSFFQIYLNSSNQIRVDINGSFLFLGGSINANTQYKIAFAYKSGNYALYLNGVQIAISTSTTIPSSLNDLYIGNSLGFEQSGSYKSVQLYKTRLTNDELTSLTTL
jgi:hypothetical protein